MFRRCIYSTLTLLWFVAATAHASIFVPTGLNPGDTYHLAFVTRDGRDAFSSVIGDYNAFVQAQAALNPTLTGTDMGVTWKAIATTTSVDARDNAPVTAPVYLLDGTTKVADGFADMWDNYLDAPIDITQMGDHLPSTMVWSGTHPGVPGGVTPYELGTLYGGPNPNSMVGNTAYSDSRWASWAIQKQFLHYKLYALSNVLTAPTLGDPIPEPASVVVWLVLASVLGVGTRLRRRRGRGV